MSRKTRPADTPAATNRVNHLRQLVIGVTLVLAGLVFAAGVWYANSGGDPDSFVAGEHYRVIEGAPAREPGTPITVTEFFSWACAHCRAFDPMLEEWRETLADDVRFERMPAAFAMDWAVLARAYYALEEVGALEANHERLFRAIHDARKQFLSLESVADYVDGTGTTRAAFIAAANGPVVARRLREAERVQLTAGITGVPSLMVAGRYVVGMREGRKAALAIVDHLIAQERAGGEMPQPPATQ